MERRRERVVLATAATLAVCLPVAAHRYAAHRIDDGVEPALSDALGVDVSIDAVAVDLDGTLRLDDVRVGDVVGADAIEASVGLASLLAGEVRPDEIRVSSPHVRVAVDDDGRTNLERLSQRIGERRRARAPAAATAASSHRPRLRRVIVTGGDLVVDLGARGSLTLRGVEALPRGGGVRLLVGGGDVDLTARGAHLRGELGRASADIALPAMSVRRALAVGGELEVDAGGEPAILRDAVLAHRTDDRRDSRLIARVPRAGTDGHISVRVPATRDRVSIDAAGVPLAAIAPHLPAAIEVDGATVTGRAAIRTELAGIDAAFEGNLHGARLRDRRIAGVPVPIDADLVIAAHRGPDALVVDRAELRAGAIDLRASGRIDGHGAATTGRIRAELAPAPCSDVLASLPRPMRESLIGMRMSGTFAARIDLDFSRKDERDTRLEVDLDPDRCKVLGEPPAADPRALTSAFDHRLPNGASAADDYVTLRSLPRYVPKAWVAAEDAAFFAHHGFDLRQIERSLAVDLRAGGFVRGGSTISQQLVKNVFLSHERTVARKLQEAVLTWRVERHLDKKQILERYLNVIELGPDIYGLPAAARHWFGKRPKDLSVAETAFLVALTPEPQSASRRIRERGELDPETAQRMRVILRHMRRAGAISESQYDRARRHPPSLARALTARR